MKKVIKIKTHILKSLIILLMISSAAYSQRSKIEGIIKDAETGEPLFGANVVLLNTNLGGATDFEGRYFIINVPVGTYQLQASMIGYAKQVVVNVLVSADRLTKIDFSLSPDVIQSDEVIVVADRNVLHKEVSNTQLVITDDQILNAAGVRDINAFLEKQPGVASENGFLQIRGGSADQTGTFINGMSYNNAAVGNAETAIPLSAIDQVSLLAGGFNAEYGNFRSGLINVTTKSGNKNKYSGTITLSRNIAHLKRFGPYLSDPHSPELAPYLQADLAFTGNSQFDGWINRAEDFNQGKLPEDQASPLDYYLLAAWMHMAIPDYEGLAKLGYTVPEDQKKLFEEHARKEEGIDYDIDAGFGGPLPFVSSYLGDATFFLSHTAKENHYVVPMSRRSQQNFITLATVKSYPSNSLTLTLNGMWKRQLGISPLKPAFGDSPNADREGGFMPLNNIKYFADLDNRDEGVNYWFDPPIFPLLDQTTQLGGFNLNNVINNTTYWEFAASYLSIKDHSPTGDNRDPRILTVFGPFPVTEMPYGKLQFAPNNRIVYINGIDTIDYQYPNYDALPGVSRRFRGKEGDLYTDVHTQQLRFKFDIVSQLGTHHYFKSGIEYNRIDINHNLWLKWNRTGPYNSFEYNYHRIPSQTGFYLQDQISYEGINANIGFRLDYYYGGGGKWPTGDAYSFAYTSTFGGAPRNPGAAADSFYAILASGRSLIWEKWEEYDRENPGFLLPVQNHLAFSPRLGIAFPVTENSKFYFNYGHARSNPPYYSMFLYKYRYDKNGLYEMSNPNLEPPKTISYELGLSYDAFQNVILNLVGYYKDVTGENGEIGYLNVDGTIDYDRWENNKYEDIMGFEINITKNDLSWITGWLNFNYMLKKSGYTGLASLSETTVDEERLNLAAGSVERFLPRPTVNGNISFRTPDALFGDNIFSDIISDLSTSFFLEWRAGSYFTFNPLNKLHLSNNMQWPDYYMIDVRLSKTFHLFGLNTTLFVDVSNLLNFKIDLMNYGYPFKAATDDEGHFTEWTDTKEYLSSLRLPIYNSGEYDLLRTQNPGLYIPGDDKVGDLQSEEKPYINNPDHTYFLHGRPRDIWFGIKVDF